MSRVGGKIQKIIDSTGLPCGVPGIIIPLTRKIGSVKNVISDVIHLSTRVWYVL
jgi:hypothetical protein